MIDFPLWIVAAGLPILALLTATAAWRRRLRRLPASPQKGTGNVESFDHAMTSKTLDSDEPASTITLRFVRRPDRKMAISLHCNVHVSHRDEEQTVEDWLEEHLNMAATMMHHRTTVFERDTP